MIVTLFAFILGSVVGVTHMPWWEALPAFKPVSLVSTLGPFGALALMLLVFGTLAFATIRAEGQAGIPAPLVAGALGLAVVQVATLTLSGRPWGVTSAFALWGSKALAHAGVDVGSWPYWTTRAEELRASAARDVTSVMDFGIMLGALLAAALAGRFAPSWRVPARSLAAAVVGGLFLGYGARIAYGCNIGALFSGIASGSLHGWLWLAAAFAGNALGTRLRPVFGLRV